uniref:Eukaryotic translation initiation factor 3 subunit B n=1 Tax=Strigamia maritima TaxID=126957 RepID=T1IVX1_STRMM
MADDGHAVLDNISKLERIEVDNHLENGEDDDGIFSDPDDYIDDITEEELIGDLLIQRPKETDSVESIIVVDGIPQVGPERLEKLQNVIRKMYSKFGTIVSDHYPTEDNMTKGYVFIEYSSPVNALEAMKTTYGQKLDRSHTFIVNLMSDFDKYNVNVNDDWIKPEPTPYVDRGNLYYWLLNPDCYDQYSVIYNGGSKTSVWLNSLPEATCLQDRDHWTDTYVRWSPLGTYLATFHIKGIALWGGENFEQIMKFSHPGVQYIDFSPCENYLVTLNPILENTEDPHNLIIFDVLTGSIRRSFSCECTHIWPIFKWSSDDEYFARCSQDGLLSVYQTPSFGLVGKKSLKIPGLQDFTWSPTDNIIAYWVAEHKDVPARVTLMDVATKEEIRVKNLFNVADCKMHWQKSGDYLCVKVDRYSKVRKEKNDIKYSGMYCNFEIFHMREKQIPVDSVELKEIIVAFAWEPIGNKCCIIHGEVPNIMVSFYGVKAGGTVSMLKKFERKQCTHIFWAPQGQFIVLAGLRNMNGALEFVDTADMTVMNVTEHFSATDVEWDPTGRYIVTGVSYWGHKVDNSYWVWSFQGTLLQKVTMERFCQLLWRPRPTTLLTQDQIKEIRKNLKKYSVQFEMDDRLRRTKASKELIEKRRRLLKEFEEYRQEKAEQFESLKERRLELRDNVDTDELYSHLDNMEEETVEFFIKEEIIILDEE